MADVKEWTRQVEAAFASVVVDHEGDDARLSALRMSIVELMSAAYQEGLREADALQEKRRLVAMLAASEPSTNPKSRDVNVEAAVQMANQIIATVT